MNRISTKKLWLIVILVLLLLISCIWIWYGIELKAIEAEKQNVHAML